MAKSTVSDSREKELKKKMAQSVAGSAPSMVPVAKSTVPLPPEEEQIPSIDQLIADDDERTIFRNLISLRIELDSKLKPLEKAKDAATDRIKTLLGTYGINNLICDGAKVSYTMQERKTLNQTKLMAAGVDMETIVACTDISKSGTLRVTPAKD